MITVITAACLVFAVCAPIWAICRFLKVQLPKFVLPVLAGLTLLSFNAYMRYTWVDRTAEQFPPEIVVLQTYQTGSLFEPWTFIFPRVSHFIAADTRRTKTNPDHPEVVMGAMVMMQEHQDTIDMTVLINCGERLVSVVPTSQIAQGANPMDTARWSGEEQFPYVVPFYCKD